MQISAIFSQKFKIDLVQNYAFQMQALLSILTEDDSGNMMCIFKDLSGQKKSDEEHTRLTIRGTAQKWF